MLLSLVRSLPYECVEHLVTVAVCVCVCSKGSLVVHFQLVVVVSGESTKESFQQQLQEELRKEDGLFHSYINDPTTAKLTMVPLSEHTTTPSTEKPVHPTTATLETRPTIQSLITTASDTITTIAGNYFIHPNDQSDPQCVI